MDQKTRRIFRYRSYCHSKWELGSAGKAITGAETMTIVMGTLPVPDGHQERRGFPFSHGEELMKMEWCIVFNCEMRQMAELNFFHRKKIYQKHIDESPIIFKKYNQMFQP